MNRACLVLALSLFACAARAEPMAEALADAYGASARLRAAEAQMRGAGEAMAQALAHRLPSLTLTGLAGYEQDSSDDANPFGASERSAQSYWSGEADLSLTQVLYRGGAIAATIDKADSGRMQAHLNLIATEQTVLLAAATAYLDVVLAQDRMAAARRGQDGVRKRFDAAQAALGRGRGTVVDLDQAITRLEDANVSVRQAEGALLAALAAYQRWIGHPPAGRLTVPPFPPLAAGPDRRNLAMELAESDHPSVRAAQLAIDSAVADREVAAASRLPTVALVGQGRRHYEEMAGFRGAETDWGILLQIRVPLYQGGGPAAAERAAAYQVMARRQDLAQARAQARAGAAQAWDGAVAARARLSAGQVRQQAAITTLGGLEREQAQGTRSVLDVLNGQQDVLDAEMAVATASHDLALAHFQLLAAIGTLDSAHLGLPVAAYGRAGQVDPLAAALPVLDWFGLGAAVGD